MKIEKVNSNQIRCTLSKTDLIDRAIKISELAYGTEKAQELFRDMMEQASDEFGFDANDTPLMIEAIPLSSESIMLIITKVDNPEDLDDKLANLPVKNIRKFKKKENTKSNDIKEHTSKESNDSANVIVYSFKSLDEVTRATNLIYSLYDGLNSLYKDNKAIKYYMVLHKSDDDTQAFLGLNGLLSEYGYKITARSLIDSFYSEHYETIIKDKAVQILQNI